MLHVHAHLGDWRWGCSCGWCCCCFCCCFLLLLLLLLLLLFLLLFLLLLVVVVVVVVVVVSWSWTFRKGSLSPNNKLLVPFWFQGSSLEEAQVSYETSVCCDGKNTVEHCAKIQVFPWLMTLKLLEYWWLTVLFYVPLLVQHQPSAFGFPVSLAITICWQMRVLENWQKSRDQQEVLPHCLLWKKEKFITTPTENDL